MTDLADFTVGDRVVRPSLSEIRAGDEKVHVEPRSIDVLIAMAERGGEVCPKKELIEAVWGGAFVSDEVLTHAIWDLRRAFGDDASHPRFIQTIPKRGYRLIAPVVSIEPEPAAAGRPAVGRYAVAGLVAVTALAVALAWWRGDSEPRSTGAGHTLVLVSPPPDAPYPAAQRRLYDDLVDELAGAQGVDLVSGTSCDPAAHGSASLCLTIALERIGDSYLIQPRLIEAETGTFAWAPAQPVKMTEARDASRTAAREVEQLVKAYLRVIDMDVYSDADIRPWFDFSRHDTRAIGDFLEGVQYVYTNQHGGRNPLDVAADRDPDFVAPRVWRIPTLASARDDPRKLAAYLEDLHRLYPAADSFERPMIQWALAVADGDVPKQLLELSIALAKEPDNRPVSFMLGVTRLEAGNLEGAWELLEPLVDRQWRHPGLYSAAASCAILLERPEEAQELLGHAAARSPVDAETFELLELLAIYDGATEAAARHRDSKLRRIEELGDPYLFDAAPLAGKLAEMARAEGRVAVATRLREFSG